MAAPVRHLVLDTEAASALLSDRRNNPKRAVVLEAVAAANGRRVTPAAVRVETGWDRTEPTAANANRLVADDDSLDRRGADRAVRLRAATPSASVVDAAVAVAAARVATTGDIVEILTADLPDLRALTAALAADVDVRRL